MQGPLFKAIHGELSNLRWDVRKDDLKFAYKKGNRKEIDDWQLLHDFTQGLGGGGPIPRSKYIFDHLDLPQVSRASFLYPEHYQNNGTFRCLCGCSDDGALKCIDKKCMWKRKCNESAEHLLEQAQNFALIYVALQHKVPERTPSTGELKINLSFVTLLRSLTTWLLATCYWTKIAAQRISICTETPPMLAGQSFHGIWRDLLESVMALEASQHQTIVYLLASNGIVPFIVTAHIPRCAYTSIRSLYRRTWRTYLPVSKDSERNINEYCL